MRGEWCYFKSHFSKAQCEAIRDAVLLRDGQQATMGVEGKATDTEMRNSQIRFVQKDDPQLGFLFDKLWKLALAANDQWFGFHISKLDYIQMAEYDSAYRGEYKRHHDIFYMNGDPHYHRKLSCVVQLTDPAEYAGGDLTFFEVAESPNAQELREQGTVIFFPSFVHHAAMPVETGKRYSIAAWFDGPKWR